ncbi:MAG: DMT family transporter [Alphaproteobacteria bacterium]|jgi:S-adenosylmethionine uptake transporter|nr:DMT family transporter [Alphaproteobacteria bacterium]
MSASSSDNLGGLRFLVLNEVFTLSHLVLVKMLGIEFSSVQIVFIRCLSSAMLLVPLLVWKGAFADVRTQLGLNGLRVLLSSVAITVNFFTISQIQLAQMSTIGYLRPAVTSLIAYFFLKESQTWHRWLVIVIGFSAVLFIFSPEESHLQIVALLALCGMCCGSSATILQKYLSRDMSDLPLMVWYSVGVAIVTAPFAIWFWATPAPQELLMMVMTGLLATMAQFFFIRAFRKADASFLAPMFYFHIVPTTLIGFFVFSEVPSLNTILGALIILASLIGMTLLERRRSPNNASM